MGNVVLKPNRPTRLQPVKHTPPYKIVPQHVSPYGDGRPPRRKKKGRLLQGIIITIGAMGLTVLVIHANDTWMPPVKELIGGTGASVKETRCPSDMSFVSDSGGGFCIDKYEASAGKTCSHSSPANQFETNDNMSQILCVPQSVADAEPWVNIPESQAMELCARAGKHLAQNAEWYRAALGTPDDIVATTNSQGCVLGRVGINSGEKTGSHSSCVSSAGAYDMIGNVWEWVDGNVSDGAYKGRELPQEGYVAETDVDGVPVKTATSSTVVFHNDYLYLKRDGVSGMIRGGFWNLTDKAGVATINATIPTTFIGNAVGFRCAR